MLRKRLMGLFVLTVFFASCGNQQNKTNNDKTLDSADHTDAKTEVKTKNILFFGTSLTAGYGLDPTEAYPALIQNRIDSLKLPYKVINAGLSGETSAGGKGRIDWLLKQPVDVFVLELGSNDGLRGLPVAQTIKNLQDIIDRVKAKYPNAKLVLAGMQIPPNMGAQYASDFKNMFPDLAKKNNMALIPFLLDKVGGIPKLNQADGIHPTAEGDKILAENVWVILKDQLK
ncbi:arylesterase [Pedobacter punctiformis]|uniref:Arylesterase n=1 Tax=Pedobacter punctiformis TaxID=3004097 RepID=A0ABT4LD29_9SPHI|nr:arylesterase [Pedobacter sp. HCMS5-2]MCZ4244724.1 arylesterase [Pedobacter sp. HCMS5-2]